MSAQLPSFFIFLDKPVGITSHQCLARFRRRFGFDKIGHHGTLDPFASGLLLAGVGEAVKFFRFLNDDFKSYEAVIRFGAATDTLDRTGAVTATAEVPQYSTGDFSAALQSLTGQRLQTPPMYSAVKIGGKKLYELARAGLEVAREPREVEIRELVLLDWQKPDLKVRTVVSRGTYIRVLAEQIAEKMATVAHLVSLRRTVLLGKTADDAVDPEAPGELPAEKLIAIGDLIGGEKRVEVSATQYQDLYAGRRPPWSGNTGDGGNFARAYHQDCFIGMVLVRDGRLIAERLMRLGLPPSGFDRI